MSAVLPVRWKIGDPSMLSWRVWGDEHVVFDGRSGQLHLLNALAAEVLKSLHEEPADAELLTQRLLSALELDPAPGLVDQVSALLIELDKLGLAEPIDG
jgi:PqqD family protein of HPr-rel-A system